MAMASMTTYEDRVAEIEGMKMVLAQMEQLVEEMEEQLARMPPEGCHLATRELGRKAVEEAWERISSKYDVVIAKEMELQEAHFCEGRPSSLRSSA